MTKYLFLYWNPPGPEKQPSPEEMQQMLAQWAAWKEKFKAQVVDMGDGLAHGGRTIRGDEILDGPYPEAKEIIGGFSIIEAKDYDEAIRVAKECPIMFMPGASIEIRQMMGY